MKLRQCCASEGTRMVLLLIENGANPNMQNNEGKTALMYGLRDDALESSEALIENGANINLQDNYGNTALIRAVHGSYKIIHWLIDKGADVNIRNNKGDSALIEASGYPSENYENLYKICIELTAAGAHINATNNKGETALLKMAGRYVSIEDMPILYKICRWLLISGADGKIEDLKGNSALKLIAERTTGNWTVPAIESQKKDLCELLIGTMLKPTKEQINSVIALLGIAKKRNTKELNLIGKDVVKLIGRKKLDAIKCENREKIKDQIMTINHLLIRQRLLKYFEGLIATQKLAC